MASDPCEEGFRILSGAACIVDIWSLSQVSCCIPESKGLEVALSIIPRASSFVEQTEELVVIAPTGSVELKSSFLVLPSSPPDAFRVQVVASIPKVIGVTNSGSSSSFESSSGK